MKRHYEVLDGLRGVAALGVLWLHINWVSGHYRQPPNAHLAVDFFFCLSGFVIAHAYEEKLRGGMSFGGFVLERLVRLLPLAVVGALMGGSGLLVRAYAVHDISPLNIFAATALNALLLPSGPLISIRPEAFGTDTPFWSLFWEMAVNTAFALTVVRLATPRLVAVS